MFEANVMTALKLISPSKRMVQLLLALPPGQHPYKKMASASTDPNSNKFTNIKAN